MIFAPGAMPDEADLSPCAYPSRYLAFHYWYIIPVAGVFVDEDLAKELELTHGSQVYGTQWGGNYQGQYQAWHRFYNPTTGRWTTPDPAAAPWTNLVGYVGESPINRSDPTGLTFNLPSVRVVPVGPPLEFDCGGFSHTVRFTLQFPAPCDGYIVQQVRYWSQIINCDGTPRTQFNDPSNPFYPLSGVYWEAWPVSKGEVNPDLSGSWGNWTLDDVADTFSRPQEFDSMGFHVMIGLVRFYCKGTTGDLGTYSAPPAAHNGWFPGNSLGTELSDPASQAGSLPATSSRLAASFWNLPMPYHGGTSGRVASSNWFCCGGVVSPREVGTGVHSSESLGVTQPEYNPVHSSVLDRL